MKKKNILELIKYHVEENDYMFKKVAANISNYFEKEKDYEVSDYINSLLYSNKNFIPQEIKRNYKYLNLEPRIKENETINLPSKIINEFEGIINSIVNNTNINKFLLAGSPGTGKTESVRVVSKLLDLDLYSVNMEKLVDSRLGETSKNVKNLFNEIKSLTNKKRCIVLFDELDSIAMDRINSNDSREMGRTTSTFLKEMEALNSNVVIFSTTNLVDSFDNALLRRFNYVINFDQYLRSDLIEVATHILSAQLNIYKSSKSNKKTFVKILEQIKDIPYPGELKNIISMCFAFSNRSDENGYLIKFYKKIFELNNIKTTPEELKKRGFTLREIEILTKTSKSTLSRNLKEIVNEKSK